MHAEESLGLSWCFSRVPLIVFLLRSVRTCSRDGIMGWIAKIGKTISIYTPLTTDVFHVSLVPQCQSTTHLNKPEVLLPLCQFRVYNERAFSMGREEKQKRWGGGVLGKGVDVGAMYSCRNDEAWRR